MKVNYKTRIYIRYIYVVIISSIIISMLTCPVIGEDNQSRDNESINKSVTYRIVIDQSHGFYRVYYANTSGKAISIPYNGTLNINEGDTITWINDAVPDTKFTIMNQQKLWDNYTGVLKWTYKQFSYTFNKSGTYDIYIKEYSKFKQKIIVGSITNITEPNSTNVAKSNLISNLSKTNSPKVNSSKMNMTNISIMSSSKANLSDTNMTNVSIDIPENNGIKPIIYLSVLPIAIIILMTYTTKMRNKRM